MYTQELKNDTNRIKLVQKEYNKQYIIGISGEER